MSRAAGPRAPATTGNAIGMWAILATGWGLAAIAALGWAAARATAALTGGRCEPFGMKFVSDVLRGDTRAAWPGTPTAAVLAVTAVLLAALITAGVLACRIVARHRAPAGDPVAALRRNPGIAPLTPGPAARTAVRLRPSLKAAGSRAVTAADTGLVLGEQRQPGRRGPLLFASWEDTVIAFMAPRSGKTTSMGLPYVLSAPGAVVATSIKEDLWAATARLRAGAGRVWLFDPQHITGQRQVWWWDPLDGLATVEAAHRMATHFVLTVADGRQRDLWGPAAQELLCALFLAAAASGRSMRDVSRWLDETASPTPAELLDGAGFRALGSSLRGAQHGAPETRDGIYQTARTAAACLHDEEIMRWVTAPAAASLPAFSPSAFAGSGDTLYLMTESRAAASPLVAALTDLVMRAGRRRAELAGRRLDPPMVLVLGRAAPDQRFVV